MNDLYLFLIYSAALIAVMLVAELSYRYLKISTERTRKTVHIGSGIVALTYPKFIENHFVVLALTLSFTLILYISKKKGLFQSIFAVKRKSYGELFFVWSSWLLFLIYSYTGNNIYFYLPFAIVVFADPAAALVGQVFPIKKYSFFGSQKSLGGSLAFFFVTMFLVFLFMPVSEYDNLYFYLYVIIFSIVITFVEAVSLSGIDNLSIPVVAVILLKIYLN